MNGDETLWQFGWALAIVLVLRFLLSRAVTRRLCECSAGRQAAGNDDQPTVGSEGLARARRQFILTLVLLAIIVIVSVLTHLQSS